MRALLVGWLGCMAWFIGAFGAPGAYAAADSDLTYLLEAKPELVTRADLDRYAEWSEARFRRYHQFNGIHWPGIRSSGAVADPDRFGSGGDSAIFTGMYVSAATYRFLVTRRTSDLDLVLESLRGLHILTHISGVPGVIARCAFPLDQGLEQKFRYPGEWERWRTAGLLFESEAPVADPYDSRQLYPRMAFITKATKDQLTGILYGLSVIQALLPVEAGRDAIQREKILLARQVVRTITFALWSRLKSTGFRLLDHTGHSGTDADRPEGMLRLSLMTLTRVVAQEAGQTPIALDAEKHARKEWKKKFELGGSGFKDLALRWTPLTAYYAWNLRFLQSNSVHLLEIDPRRREKVSSYLHRQLWSRVKTHENSLFTFIHASTRLPSDAERLDRAVYGLKALTLRPTRLWSSPLWGRTPKFSAWQLAYHDLSKHVVPVHLRKPEIDLIWQRDPYDLGSVFDAEGLEEATRLDFLLPYWMGRYHRYL